MKNNRLALILGAALVSSAASAGVFTINPTPAPITGGGGGTTPAAIAFVYTPGAGDTTIGFQASIAFNTAQVSATVTNGAGANGTGGGCSVASPGVIRIAAADNNNAALQTGTYCNLTFTSLAGFTTGTSALPITITGGGKGCFDAGGNPTTCTKVDGSLAISAGNSWAATPNPLAVGSAPAGGTATANVVLTATAGNAAAGSITACTFAGANAASFNSSATFPLALAQTGATNLPIRFQPPGAAAAGAQTATVSCTGAAGTILTGFPITLNGTVTAPSITAALTPATLTFASTVVGGNTATQNVVITAPAGNTGPIAINACTIGGANATQFNFNPAFAAVNIAAGATANVPVRFSPTAAGAAAATVTCTTSTASATVTGTVNLTGTGTAPVGVVTPVTAPGNVSLPSYTVGTALSSTTNLQFNVATANGAVACVAAGAGYSATPNPLNLVVGTAGSVAVTFTGSVAGTFTGTLTCNAVAPASGGPFVYNLSTAVATPPPVAVPTLGVFGMLLLVAGFLGLGMVLVNRRQA